MERTFAIIKPDAVKSRYTGRILQRIEEAGFTIRAMQMRSLSAKEAEGFHLHARGGISANDASISSCTWPPITSVSAGAVPR